MPLQNFISGVTVATAAWLNKVDTLLFTVFAEATTAAQARTALGVTATGADTAYCLRSNNLSDVTAATARTNLGLGSAATLTAGTAANNVVQLDGSSKLPAVDGSQLTNISPAYQRGYIDGLILSYSSATTIGISAGKCRSTADDANISLASAFTKVIQAAGSYTAGTGQNGLFSGARANSTWYHVFAGLVSGVADIGFDTSVTAANKPGSFTNPRRIGSVKTDGSGNIIAFKQNGDMFEWDVMPASADVNVTNPGTAAVTRTLSVPTGLKVNALFSYSSANGSNNHFVLITDLSQTDTTPSGVANSWGASSVGLSTVTGRSMCWTNTSGQVRSRLSASGASDTLVMNAYGWIDPRGKDS